MKILSVIVGWLLSIWGILFAVAVIIAGLAHFTIGHVLTVVAALAFLLAVNPITRKRIPITRSAWAATGVALAATLAGFIGLAVTGSAVSPASAPSASSTSPSSPSAPEQASGSASEADGAKRVLDRVFLEDGPLITDVLETSASPALKTYLDRPGIKLQLLGTMQSTTPQEAQGCLNVYFRQYQDDKKNHPQKAKAEEIAWETSADMAFWDAVTFAHAARVHFAELRKTTNDVKSQASDSESVARLKQIRIDYELHPAPMTVASCQDRRGSPPNS